MQRITPLHVRVKGQEFDFHLGYATKPETDKERSRLKGLGYKVHTVRVAISAGNHPQIMRYLYVAHKKTHKARLTR